MSTLPKVKALVALLAGATALAGCAVAEPLFDQVKVGVPRKN